MLKELLELKILIVDDDLTTRELLKELLQKQGYKTMVTANSGEQALELVKIDPPDLILLDVFMTGIEGYEVCQRLKADDTTSYIPIVMVTGGAIRADEALKKSFQAGATDFITKPIRAIEFLARVKAGLTIKSNHDKLAKEIERRKNAEKIKEKFIEKLEQALSEIKTLQGIIPICSHCRKLRDDKGYWKILEAYLQDYSDATFSHGICPDCSEKFYGKNDWYAEMKEKKKKK